MSEKTAGIRKDKTNPKLMTARQVQEEYLDIDIRRLRVFLNTYCHYRKIGRQYYYVRDEVEKSSWKRMEIWNTNWRRAAISPK